MWRLQARPAQTSTQTSEYVRVTAYQLSCLSCIAVKPLPPVIPAIDYHKPLWSALGLIIDRDAHKITIDPKYADDISFLRSDEPEINQVEREIPFMLLTEGFHVNESKTERYHIQRGGEDAWKKCKYLRSLLDTEYQKAKRTYHWLTQDIRIYFQ